MFVKVSLLARKELMQHLASNRRRIAATRVMQPLATLLRSEFDIVGPLQAATIAVLKHLLNSDRECCLDPPLTDELTISFSIELARIRRYSFNFRLYRIQFNCRRTTSTAYGILTRAARQNRRCAITVRNYSCFH